MKQLILLFLIVKTIFATSFYPIDTSKVWQYRIGLKQIMDTTWLVKCSASVCDSTYGGSVGTEFYEDDDSIAQRAFSYSASFADSTFIITHSTLKNDGSYNQTDIDLEMIYHSRIYACDTPGIPRSFRWIHTTPDQLTSEDSALMQNAVPYFAGPITVPYGTFDSCYAIHRTNSPNTAYFVKNVGLVRATRYLSKYDSTALAFELLNIVPKNSVSIQNTTTHEVNLLSTYPNPCNSDLTLFSSRLIENITLYCTNGQKARIFNKINSYSHTLKMGSLPHGIYFVVAEIGSNRIIKKIIHTK